MNRDQRQFTPPTVIDVLRGSATQEHPLDPRTAFNGGYGKPWTGLYKGTPDSLPQAAGPIMPPFDRAISASGMTFAAFVEAKFIPEHVSFKTVAGQRHYQAILKHLMAPEHVDRIFNPQNRMTARLRSAFGWPYLDGVRLCDLSSDHVHRLVTAANAAGYSSQTVKHIKNVLCAIIAHAQREGCFNRPNPASLVKLGKVIRRKQQNLTLHETKALLRVLPYPAKEIAIFAITTDMNLGEICDLRWKHVNLSVEERFVDGEPIPALSIAVRTAGDKFGGRSSRAVSRNRNIEIREPLLSHLKKLIRRTLNCNCDDRVLLSNDGRPILPSRFRKSFWMHIGKALGMPWLTWQILRRARSSFMGELLAQLSEPKVSNRSGDRLNARNPSEVSREHHFGDGLKTVRADVPRTFCFGGRFARGKAPRLTQQ